MIRDVSNSDSKIGNFLIPNRMRLFEKAMTITMTISMTMVVVTKMTMRTTYLD